MLDLHFAFFDAILRKEISNIHMFGSLAARFAPINEEVTGTDVVLKHLGFVDSVALRSNKIITPEDLRAGIVHAHDL